MAIAGVGTGYDFQAGFSKKMKQNTGSGFYGNISSASEITEELNDSILLGLTMIPDGSSKVTYGMRAQYAADSTEENPIVQVTSNYGGETVSYRVKINEVDPRNASQLEMFALCSYADDKGNSNKGTFGSFQKLKYYAANAQMNGYCSNMEGNEKFINMKFNWEETVSKMMNDYLEGGNYKQYQDGSGLLELFDQFETRDKK